MLLTNLVLESLDFVLDELDHVTACVTDHVLVMFSAKCPLIFGGSIPVVVSSEQANFDQTADRAVDRRPGYLSVASVQTPCKALGVEMPID